MQYDKHTHTHIANMISYIEYNDKGLDNDIYQRVTHIYDMITFPIDNDKSLIHSINSLHNHLNNNKDNANIHDIVLLNRIQILMANIKHLNDSI